MPVEDDGSVCGAAPTQLARQVSEVKIESARRVLPSEDGNETRVGRSRHIFISRLGILENRHGRATSYYDGLFISGARDP